MNKSIRTIFTLLVIGLLTLLIPETAYAYGGPGSVISGIGAFLAAIGAVIAAIFGFLWFPIKRLFTSSDEEEEPAEEEVNQSSE